MLRELKEAARRRRKKRMSWKIKGNAERPRLAVFKSARHIYAQVIDDDQGTVLASASTLSPELRLRVKGKRKTEAARGVGALIAEKALTREIKKVVFDRNGFLYHGRIQALADAAREKGLDF